jgi:hypothetical protein
LELEETIAARAKGNQKSDNLIPVDTKRELAAIAGVSHDTVAKVKKIEAKADDLLAEIAEQVENERREKQKANAVNQYTEASGKKLPEPAIDPDANKTATKAAELFNHWPPP